MKYFSLLLMLLSVAACFSDQKKWSETIQSPVADSCDFMSVYQFIFSESCNLNGCHDGSFEPDFSTPASAYQTLLYHPIIKNNKDSAYRFRVVPFDTSASVLYARVSQCCFVNQDDRMPQHTIGEALPEVQIQRIAAWIMNGAPDMFGHVPDTSRWNSILSYSP